MDLKTNLHINSKRAGQLLYWSGTDTYERWLKNYSNPENIQYLNENSWNTSTSISYQYNSDGFRCSEFNDQPTYLALGCSFTEGVGLSSEQTWSNILSKEIGCSILNLGVGGAGLDLCFRILDYYIDKLNVLGVCLLEPDPARYEVFVNSIPDTLSAVANITNNTNWYLQWVTEDSNVYYNSLKNIYAMQYLCKKKNIDFISLKHNGYGVANDVARDLLHSGPKTHQCIANAFKTIIQKNG